MYLLTEEDALRIGEWAVCSHHELGRITGRKELSWGVSWVGKKLDGTPWASRNPIFLGKEQSLLLNELFEFKFMYEGLLD